MIATAMENWLVLGLAALQFADVRCLSVFLILRMYRVIVPTTFSTIKYMDGFLFNLVFANIKLHCACVIVFIADKR